MGAMNNDRWQKLGAAVLFAAALTGFQVFNRTQQTGITRIDLLDVLGFIVLMLVIYVVAGVARRTSRKTRPRNLE